VRYDEFIVVLPPPRIYSNNIPTKKECPICRIQIILGKRRLRL
jgi:hypothetical protein